MREDGYVFAFYKHGRPQWYSPAAWHRRQVLNAFGRARRRASAAGVPFDIDAAYLRAIYPADGRCPALGMPLVWGGASASNSPSLDRIKPDKGYVRGNICWLSQQANQIKTNATTAQVCAVADFLRKNDY